MPATFTSDSPEAEDELEPNNSRPVDFNTFVPKHDPSLPNGKGAGVKMASGSTGAWRGIVPPAPAMSSQATPDEAFEHAMGAWYWAGYWTGVYHVSYLPPMLRQRIQRLIHYFSRLPLKRQCSKNMGKIPTRMRPWSILPD